MKIQSFGAMAVDWEERIDFDRLRQERLERAQEQLQATEAAAFLCFDMNVSCSLVNSPGEIHHAEHAGGELPGPQPRRAAKMSRTSGDGIRRSDSISEM